MKNELYHHGVKGQSWGTRHGPPYPLDSRTTAKKYLQKELKAVNKDINSMLNTNILDNSKSVRWNARKINKFIKSFEKASAYEYCTSKRLEKIMDMPIKQVSKLSKNPTSGRKKEGYDSKESSKTLSNALNKIKNDFDKSGMSYNKSTLIMRKVNSHIEFERNTLRQAVIALAAGATAGLGVLTMGPIGVTAGYGAGIGGSMASQYLSNKDPILNELHRFSDKNGYTNNINRLSSRKHKK